MIYLLYYKLYLDHDPPNESVEPFLGGALDATITVTLLYLVYLFVSNPSYPVPI